MNLKAINSLLPFLLALISLFSFQLTRQSGISTIKTAAVQVESTLYRKKGATRALSFIQAFFCIIEKPDSGSIFPFKKYMSETALSIATQQICHSHKIAYKAIHLFIFLNLPHLDKEEYEVSSFCQKARWAYCL